MTPRSLHSLAWLAWTSALILGASLPAVAQALPGRGQPQADLVNLGVIGARGEATSTGLQVREVLPGGGAARAGLAAGDELVALDGQPLTGEQALLRLYGAIDELETGPKRKGLALSVRRAGAALDLEVPVARLGKCTGPGAKCKHCDKIVKAGLAYLAQTQAGNGCFPTELGGKTGLVVVTSLSGLALLSAGVSPKGNTPLGRAIGYVLGQANTPDSGGLGGGGGGNWNQENWGHAYALCFLGEVAHKTRRPDVLAKVKELAARLLETLEGSGGWAHGPGGPNALGYLELEIVSNYALLGLAAARNLGIELDEAKLQRALDWVAGTASRDGGVGYSHRQGQQGFGDPGRTAGALVAFAALGQRERPFFGLMSGYFTRHLGALPEGHVSPAMHLLAGAMAARVLGGEVPTTYAARYRLLALGQRRPDGSFGSLPTKESRQLGNNTDLTVGPRWTTATYLLILTLDRGNLPLLLESTPKPLGAESERAGPTGK